MKPRDEVKNAHCTKCSETIKKISEEDQKVGRVNCGSVVDPYDSEIEPSD